MSRVRGSRSGSASAFRVHTAESGNVGSGNKRSSLNPVCWPNHTRATPRSRGHPGCLLAARCSQGTGRCGAAPAPRLCRATGVRADVRLRVAPGRRLWSTCSECQHRLESPTWGHPWTQTGRIGWIQLGISSTKWMRMAAESLTSTRCESCASDWVRSSTTPRSLERSARWTLTLRGASTCRCATFARL